MNMNLNSNEEINLTQTTQASLSDINKEKFKDKKIKLNKLFINYYRDALNLPTKEFEEFLEYSEKKPTVTLRINKMK
jgi:hypothetical protein